MQARNKREEERSQEQSMENQAWARDVLQQAETLRLAGYGHCADVYRHDWS